MSQQPSPQEFSDKTRALPAEETPNGTWRNPHTPQQPAYHEPAPEARARKPRFAGLRRFIGVLLGVVALVLGSSGALAYWAQNTIVQESGFDHLTADMAQDKAFQKELSQAVTKDIMDSEQVTHFLGKSEEEANRGFRVEDLLNPSRWFEQAQAIGRDQVENAIGAATQAVTQDQNYPQVWQQVMKDTHAYNMDSQRSAAGLNLNAVYQEVDNRVGTIFGFDPDIRGTGDHIIQLEPADSSPQNSLHGNLMKIKDFAATWQTQLLAALGCALLAFVVWPRARLVFLGILVMLGAAILWGGTLLAPQISNAVDLNAIDSAAGKIFTQGLLERISTSLADFSGSYITVFLIVGGVLILLGIAVQLAQLTARSVSSRTR